MCPRPPGPVSDSSKGGVPENENSEEAVHEERVYRKGVKGVERRVYGRISSTRRDP